MSSPGEVTVWLHRLREGDVAALDRIVAVLYDELRAVARARLRAERPDHTLSPTALVNEVYLRLLGQRRIDAAGRAEFFAVAARTMRRVLVDAARTRKRLKRGGDQERVPLEDVDAALSIREADELLALEAALERLAASDPRAAEVVEKRFFAGLTLEETAASLGVSTKTIQRDWLAARAWLRKEVARELEA
jgi:RNA polymerase sigma factor (TIGR02999 family)